MCAGLALQVAKMREEEGWRREQAQETGSAQDGRPVWRFKNGASPLPGSAATLQWSAAYTPLSGAATVTLHYGFNGFSAGLLGRETAGVAKAAMRQVQGDGEW